MTATQLWRVEVRWGNPYTEPPRRRPRVLAACQIPWPKAKGAPPREEWTREILRLLRTIASPGSGWALCIGVDLQEQHAQRKQWSRERKARVRRANLRKRIEKEVGPLFGLTVSELVEREIARRPRYFQGESNE